MDTLSLRVGSQTGYKLGETGTSFKKFPLSSGPGEAVHLGCSLRYAFVLICTSY